MALTNWNDILNKPKGIDEVPEIALTVEQLSASVLSISEDVGEIAEDVQEIALEVSQLSASTLPYGPEETIKQAIDDNILIINTSVSLDYVANTWSIQVVEAPQDFSIPTGYKVISATGRTISPHADKILCDIKETTPDNFYIATYSNRSQTGVTTNLRIVLTK